MKKRGLVFSLLIAIIFLSSVSASPVDDEINKLTHYAEEYETGNINYVQLLVYSSAVRENLNELSGVTSREEGGILTQEQIRNVLGEETKSTKWVWVEERDGEGHEKRLDAEVPVWERIVFDGKIIQIRLNAYPSIFKKEYLQKGSGLKSINEEELLIYRLNFNVEFKRPEEQLDIAEKITKIKTLAEEFNADPSSKNAEALAKESVDAERAFEKSFRQNQGKCEDIMSKIFGSENIRQPMKLLIYEINFLEENNSDAIYRLEMCDDCEWNWINMNLNIEIRGPGFKQPGKKPLAESKERYKGMSFASFEEETKKLLEEIKNSLNSGDYASAYSSADKLNMMTNAWNEEANNVWNVVEEKFKSKREEFEQKMREGEPMENYWWVGFEKEKRQEVKKLMKENYGKRKAFYQTLFSSYEKKESYVEQQEWEKRLVEEFKERGEEICDNGVDDNQNSNIDCADQQCGGKICGKETNESGEVKDLYCIAGVCQVKEIIIQDKGPVCGNNICEAGENELAESEEEETEPIEGETEESPIENNTEEILLAYSDEENTENESITEDSNEEVEETETAYCPQDCVQCLEYEPLECAGEVIFSGKDKNGCPLKPVCLEKNSCESDNDCEFLCALGKCVEGKCETGELTECRESACVDGQKKLTKCETEELVSALCTNGLWEELNVECETVPEEVEEGEAVGDECTVKSDCGGENDVCSNGKCVTIPEVIRVEEPEEDEGIPGVPGLSPEDEAGAGGVTQPSEETTETAPVQESEQEPQEEPSAEEQRVVQEEIKFVPLELAKNTIFNFFKGFLSNLKITGYQIQEGEGGSPPPEGGGGEGDGEGSPEQETIPGVPEEGPPQGENMPQPPYGEQQPPQFSPEENREQDNWEDRREGEEKERRENECNERCGRECYDMKVRPCIDKCINEKCGNEFECDTEEVIKTCEEKCKSENDLEGCKDDCFGKCLAGEQTWKEPEREQNKEEKGVFNVGGGCRESVQEGGTGAYIWLNGWGEPFGEIEPLKHKYYQGNGQADWCRYDYENLIKQREELKKGFNQEFAKWFFEDYLASSAEDWEQHVSGIYELYWKGVDNSRQIVERMNCLGINELPISESELINVKYETEYGSLEFWEEFKTTKLPGIEKEVKIVSPYMKLWIFPPREFFKQEMKKGMEKGKMPGPEGGESGIPKEEKEKMKNDPKFMEWVKELNEKYGENLVVQFKDYETNEVVLNIYFKINPEEVIYMEPMLPSEVPAENIKIELDANKLLDIIESGEKTRGFELQSPPWDPKPRMGKFKEMTTGVNMWWKLRALMSSMKVTPENAEGDVEPFMKEFFKGMMGGGPGGPEGEGPKEGEMQGLEEPKDKLEGGQEGGISGKVILVKR